MPCGLLSQQGRVTERLSFNIRDTNASFSADEPWPAPSRSPRKVSRWAGRGEHKTVRHVGLLCAGCPFSLHKLKGWVVVSSFHKLGQKLREVEVPSQNYTAKVMPGVGARSKARVHALFNLPANLDLSCCCPRQAARQHALLHACREVRPPAVVSRLSNSTLTLPCGLSAWASPQVTRGEGTDSRPRSP